MVQTSPRRCAEFDSPETNGHFRVNVTLPIPFDGFGTLEVDLLCAEARVAVELDGGQQLADPIAYRRDRGKDQLLQENGYSCCAFLPRT
jgi:very-short-patch-repair endonuclease